MDGELLAYVSKMTVGDLYTYITGTVLGTGSVGVGLTHLFHRRKARNGNGAGPHSNGCPKGLDKKMDAMQLTVQATSKDVTEVKEVVNTVARDFNTLKDELFKKAIRGGD